MPRLWFRAPCVVEAFKRVEAEIGRPQMVRVDEGSEFESRDLDLWAYQRGVTLDFSRPGNPTHDAFIESLNAHWFTSLDDAVGKCEDWRRD